MNAIDKLPKVILEKVKTLFFVVQCLEMPTVIAITYIPWEIAAATERYQILEMWLFTV